MNEQMYKQMYLDTVDTQNDDAPAPRDKYLYLVAILFAVLLIGLT